MDRINVRTIDNIELKLYRSGFVCIDTLIDVDSDDCPCDVSHEERLKATTNTFLGERFDWVGNFIYTRETVIDIDPY